MPRSLERSQLLARGASPRRGRVWAAALLGAALGLCGWAAFGAARLRARDAVLEVKPPQPTKSVRSLRSALARLAVAGGAEEPESIGTLGPSPSPDADRSDDVASLELQDALRDPALDKGVESFTEDAEDAATESPHPGVMVRVRYAYYRPHWSYPWHRRDYSWGGDEESEDLEGWLFPLPRDEPVEPDASPAREDGATPCDFEARRWLVRVQGHVVSDGPGAGLVCLTAATSKRRRFEQTSLLRELVALITRGPSVPENIALVAHGTSLGVLIPPAAAQGASGLAANLRVLGLARQDERATALIEAFEPRATAPDSLEPPQAIDQELSVIVMPTRRLVALLASDPSGHELERRLELRSDQPATETLADALDALDFPSLTDDLSLGLEIEGCSRPADVTPVSNALCVGEGTRLGGSEGNTAVLFHGLEPVRASRGMPST